MRILHIRTIFAFLFVLIAGDLFYVQIIKGGYFYRLSLNNSIRVVPIEGERGRILDRTGRVLADSVRSYNAVVVPQELRNQKTLFGFLATVLPDSAQTIERRYAKNKLTPFAPVVLAEGLTRFQAIRIEENAFRYPGLMVLERFGRAYPFGEEDAHVIGYVGKADPDKMADLLRYGFSADELVGYSGIEEYYDAQLRGTPGGRQIEVNSRGRQTQLLSVREPSRGKDIVLTLDQDMQRSLHFTFSGRRGAAVVLDPATGEVLALVSSPSYDPNAFVDNDLRGLLGGYFNDKNKPLINRAVSASFPPGSLFKIPVSLAGLEERRIKPSTTYDCPGTFTLGNRVYRFPHAWGAQDLTAALAHSANEYFFYIGLMLGRDTMARYAHLFQLGERTGIDMPFESKGNIPGMGEPRWYKGDTVNMSIGQGSVLATPLQMARLMTAVENEGRMPQPYLVREMGGKVLASPLGHQVSLRRETWAAVKAGLYEVVRRKTGTAHALADIPNAQSYGKTGTAQAGADLEDHAWYAGITRTRKSALAYCFFLEHGGSSANAVALVKEFLLAVQAQNKL